MARRSGFSLFILVAMIILLVTVTEGQVRGGPFIYHRISYSGKMVVDKVIPIGIDHKGVKLEAITFSGNAALFIVWNRTPRHVKTTVGIALFDGNNRLIAAESYHRTPTIRSGKQANFGIKFDRFLADFEGVTRFHLVFSIVE